MGVATFDGTNWTFGESSLLPSGEGKYALKVGNNGKIATVISINRGKINDVNYGHNIFKYENGQWESLLTNFLEPGANQTSIAIGSFGTTVAPDGTIYAWTADDAPNADKVYQVRLKRYNADNKTWSVVSGNTLPLNFDSGIESHINVDVAIAPDGTPFVACKNTVDLDNPKLIVIYLDPTTQQWSAPVQVAEGVDDINLAFAADGTGYISYTDKSSKIHLLKYADGDPAGITTVHATKADNRIYNLQGVRVSKTNKGIYIINGKKVVK